MCVQGVQERGENTALWVSSVKGQRGGDVAVYSDRLEVQHPAAQRSVQT